MCVSPEKIECYRVERAYLGKYTAKELVGRMIREHLRQSPEEPGHEGKQDALQCGGVCQAVQGGRG